MYVLNITLSLTAHWTSADVYRQLYMGFTVRPYDTLPSYPRIDVLELLER